MSTLHRHAIFHGELTPDDVWFEHGRPLLLGPIAGVRERTAGDDIVAFGSFLGEVLAHNDSACGELSKAARERLERLLRSAVDGEFKSTIEPLVDEILWVLGDGSSCRTMADEVTNPYRGLEPFDERHASLFFGRSAAIEEIDRELRQRSFVVVVGPSGSGKSSIVRAGLVPLARNDGWFTTVMQPGSRPLDELRLALAAVATDEIDLGGGPREIADAIVGVVSAGERLLLVIDQFEELWTVAEPAQRDMLLAGLKTLVRSENAPVHVVVTLRADYLGHALGHPSVGESVRDHTTLVAPMTSVELTKAILEPARAVGVSVEPELATSIVADAGRSEGSLPLVQFALMELFERRSDDVMTLQAYRQIGGLSGVVSRRADETFERLTDDDQHAAEVALTRLISIDAMGDPTRRRVPTAELASSAAGVVDAFGKARLLTFDRDRSTREQIVEIAHESLAREWPRLRSWIDADLESLIVLRRLSLAAATWATTGRDPAELYRGTRLEVAEDWVLAHPEGLTSTEAEFLRQSRTEVDAVRMAERRRSNRLRTLAIGLAVALIAVAAAGTTAVVQHRRAVANADEADRRSVEATAQRLAVQAVEARDVDPDLAILLALEAHRRTEDAGLPPVAGAVGALNTVTQSSRLLARFAGSSVSAMSRTGNEAALAVNQSGVMLIDLLTGDEQARTSLADEVIGLWFHPRGHRVVATTVGQIVVLDSSDLSILAAQPVDCCVNTLEFHGGGELIAGGSDEPSGGSVRIWDLIDLAAVRTVDGARLAGWLGDDVVVYERSAVHSVEPNGRSRDLGVPMSPIIAVDVHPDGERLLVADDEAVAIWPIDGSDVPKRLELDGWGVLFQAVSLTVAGDAFIAYGPSDEVRWVPVDAVHSRSFRGHPSVGGVSGDGAGRRLMVSGPDETMLWDLTEEGPAELGAVAVTGDVWGIEFSDDGGVMFINDQVHDVARVRAVDVANGTTIAEATFVAAGGYIFPVIASTGLVAGWAPDSGPRVEDLTTGGVVARLGRCQVPAAIDADERWMLVSDLADIVGDGCVSNAGSVLDPRTGEVLLELPETVGMGDIGPPRTISDGLVVYQSIGPEQQGILVIRDLRSGGLVGRLESADAWRPFFSNDGRYISFGSSADGGFALDVERVLAGASLDEAIVLNPQLEGATTFSVVVGDQLVTGHAGAVLRFWSLADGRQQLSLPVTSGDSTFIASSSDDRYLYYEDEGNLLRRFPVNIDELVELANRRAQRGFRAAECERYELAEDCDSFLASR